MGRLNSSLRPTSPAQVVQHLWRLMHTSFDNSSEGISKTGYGGDPIVKQVT